MNSTDQSLPSPQIQQVSSFLKVKNTNIRVKQEVKSGSVQEINLRFSYKGFPEEDLPKAINMITYGTLTMLYYKSSNGRIKFKQGVIYIQPDNNQVIHFFDKRLQVCFEVKFLDVINIVSDPNVVPPEVLDQVGDTVVGVLTLSIMNHEQKIVQTYWAQLTTVQRRDLLHQAIQHYAIQDMYLMQFLQFLKLTIIYNQISYVQLQLSNMLHQIQNARVTPEQVDMCLKRLKFQLSSKLIENTVFVRRKHEEMPKDIDKEDFIQNFIEVLRKDSAKGIFLKYTTLRAPNIFTCVMTIDEFKNFLQVEQKELTDHEDAIALIRQIKIADQDISESDMLSYTNFSEYMFSSFNYICVNTPPEDFTYPISCYFINTAFKVFSGSVDPHKIQIIKQIHENNPDLYCLLHVLARGVKHLEIEVWDDAEQNPVIVTGAMQTRQIGLKEVADLIARYAFITSPMPLFLFIEDHCSLTGKAKLQEIINTSLGEFLLLETQVGDFLPSLRGLEFKIILCGSAKIKQLKFKQPALKQQLSEPDHKKQLEDDEVESKNKHFSFYLDGTEIMQNKTSRNFKAHVNNDEGCKQVASGNNSMCISLNNSFNVPVEFNSAISQGFNFPNHPKVLQIQHLQQQFTLYQVSLSCMDRVRDQKIIYEISDSAYQKLLAFLKEQQIQKFNSGRNLEEKKLNEQSEINKNSSLSNLEQKQNEKSETKKSSLVEEVKNSEIKLNSQVDVKKIMKYFKVQNSQIKNPRINELMSEIQFVNSLTNVFMIKQYPTERNSVLQALLQGVQMITLQHHIIDFNYMYFYAFFGGMDGIMKGYVLKQNVQQLQIKAASMSSILMSKRSSNISIFKQQYSTLKITVVSGHYLLNHVYKFTPDSNVFVQVIMRTPEFGKPENIQIRETQKIQSKTLSYHFDGEFEFTLPKNDGFYTVIMFVVYANDLENVIAWNSFKLQYIRQGYRVVPLLDEFLNNIHHSCLFTRINFS